MMRRQEDPMNHPSLSISQRGELAEQIVIGTDGNERRHDTLLGRIQVFVYITPCQEGGKLTLILISETYLTYTRRRTE